MPTLIMSLLDAKNMAAALVPHIANEGWRDSLLDNVSVGNPGGQFAYSTDRYSIGRYDLTNITREYPSEPMLIPRALLSALLSIGPATLMHNMGDYDVVIQTGPSTSHEKQWEADLRIRYRVDTKDGTPRWDMHFMRVFAATDQTKKYPPTTRLFDNWLPGEPVHNPLMLEPNYLGRFTGYGKRERKSLRITLPGAPPAGTGKSVGVLVEIGARFKGILMPILYNVAGIHDFGTDLVHMNVEREAEAKLIAETSQPTDTEDKPPMTDAASSGMP